MVRRKAAALLLLLIVTCLVIMQYTSYSISFKLGLAEGVRWKNILYWTEMFGQPDFYLGLGSEIFADCPVKNCYATNNRSYLPVDQFDAILFHGPEYSMGAFGRPKNRSLNQYYVYVNQESPANTPWFSNLTDFFNWTMTYRLDSDIIRPYGFYEKTVTAYNPPSVEEIKRRPFNVAWMVSNCETSSFRKLLYKKLSQYIEIDVYGACGNKTCSRQTPHKCYQLLEDNYKFYLSFENSLCQDYVTEKLYYILRSNLVPVVYGGADYRKVAPPKSVIDATEFKTVKELADYITFLDQNPEKYLEYFEWKKDFAVRVDSKRTLCRLCEKLNGPIEHKSYSDIYEWWSYQRTCKHGKGLPKILFT